MALKKIEKHQENAMLKKLIKSLWVNLHPPDRTYQLNKRINKRQQDKDTQTSKMRRVKSHRTRAWMIFWGDKEKPKHYNRRSNTKRKTHIRISGQSKKGIFHMWNDHSLGIYKISYYLFLNYDL